MESGIYIGFIMLSLSLLSGISVNRRQREIIKKYQEITKDYARAVALQNEAIKSLKMALERHESNVKMNYEHRN